MLTRDAIFGEGENCVTRSESYVLFCVVFPTLVEFGIGMVYANIYGGNNRSATWLSSVAVSHNHCFLFSFITISL